MNHNKDTLRQYRALIRAGIHVDRTRNDVYISKLEKDGKPILVIFALIPDQDLLTISVAEGSLFERENEPLLIDAVKNVSPDASYDEMHIVVNDDYSALLVRKCMPLRSDIGMENLYYALDETYRSYCACLEDDFSCHFVDDSN